MEIELDTSFPKDELDDLTRVAKDILQVVRERIPGEPPQGDWRITCIHHDGSPITFWPPPFAKRYHIALCIRDGRRYFQLAFQLGHELGHVMMDPSRSNGAIEIMATAMSLQTLLDMEQRWQADPPYPNWKSEAAKFRSYYDEEDKSKLSQKSLAPIRDAVKNEDWPAVAAFMRGQRPALEANPCDRTLNHLGARYLLAKNLPWKELLGVARRTFRRPDDAEKIDVNAPFAAGSIPEWLLPIWAA